MPRSLFDHVDHDAPSSVIVTTLVLHGEDDPLFPIGNGEALAAEIPDARLVRLDRIGHWLPAHAVPAVAAELLAHTAG